MPADLDALPRRREPIDTTTLTGLVDLMAPEPAAINVRAIAHGLAQINRWVGASVLAICVAQHSRMVWEIFRRLFPDERRYGIHALLHDAHEYIWNDITRPVEKRIDADFPGFSAWLGNRKNEADIAIRTALGVPEPPMQIRALVHEADMVAAHLEWRLLIPPENGPSPFALFAERHPRVPIQSIKTQLPAVAEADFRTALVTELEARRWEQ